MSFFQYKSTFVCAVGFVVISFTGCAPKPAPVTIGATDNAAFVGKWSGKWDLTYNKGTTTFVVEPDGSFTGTMFSVISNQNWPFHGAFKDGKLDGSVLVDNKEIYVVKGPAMVYSSNQLKSTAEAYKASKPVGSCVFDLTR